MREYEAISELYQAQSAVDAARVANAERYASSTFAKAQQLLAEAQQIENSKKDPSRVVQTAREAAQTAEDARVIAGKHLQDEKISQAQAEAARARQAMMQAELETRQAKADAEAAQAQMEAERAARQRADTETAVARQRTATQAPPVEMRKEVAPRDSHADDAPKTVLRANLLNQMNGALPSRDTARGLVTTVANSGFRGTVLNPTSSDKLAQIAAALVAHPGLRIEVEGHTDAADNPGVSQRRAEMVREVLISHGVPSSSISARGLGNTHPLGSNSTAAGREENQRVELVISGDAIGTHALWDRSYSLTGQ